MEEVQRNRVRSPYRTAKGFPAGTGEFKSLTGRRYTFREYDAPEWMADSSEVMTTFSPTQCKNYTIQGGATGDIVPMMIGKLLRFLKADEVLRDSFLMVNTIHDSVIFDVMDREVLEYGVPKVKAILEQAPQIFEDTFNKPFDLDLPVDVEYGKTWADMKTFKL